MSFWKVKNRSIYSTHLMSKNLASYKDEQKRQQIMDEKEYELDTLCNDNIITLMEAKKRRKPNDDNKNDDSKSDDNKKSGNNNIECEIERCLGSDTEYLKMKRKLLICFVTITLDNKGIIDAKNWIFSAYLWIPKTTTKYYRYRFEYTHKQLKAIESQIALQYNKNHQYFPNKGYPKLPKIKKNIRNDINGSDSVSIRGDKLDKEMKEEQKYLQMPKLPIVWFAFNANENHAKSFVQYLEHLFSSFGLTSEKWFYDALNINSKLAEILAWKAKERLELYEYQAEQPFLSPLNLVYKYQDNIKFHSVYICGRPLNALGKGGTNIAKHWAIRFEGIDHNLSVEFFDYIKQVPKVANVLYYNSTGSSVTFKHTKFVEMLNDPDSHGIVQCRLLANNTMNRRIFWYWWNRDEPQNITTTQRYYNQRWEVIDKIFLNRIDIELIGRLVLRWIRTKTNRKYDIVNNNCQSFVRDFTSIFHLSKARDLTTLMDSKILSHALPGGLAVDRISQGIICVYLYIWCLSIYNVSNIETRIMEAHNILLKEINEYKNHLKERKKRNTMTTVLTNTDTNNSSIKPNIIAGKFGNNLIPSVLKDIPDDLKSAISAQDMRNIIEDSKNTSIIDVQNNVDIINIIDDESVKSLHETKSEFKSDYTHNSDTTDTDTNHTSYTPEGTLIEFWDIFIIGGKKQDNNEDSNSEFVKLTTNIIKKDVNYIKYAYYVKLFCELKAMNIKRIVSHRKELKNYLINNINDINQNKSIHIFIKELCVGIHQANMEDLNIIKHKTETFVDNDDELNIGPNITECNNENYCQYKCWERLQYLHHWYYTNYDDLFKDGTKSIESELFKVLVYTKDDNKYNIKYGFNDLINDIQHIETYHHMFLEVKQFTKDIQTCNKTNNTCPIKQFNELNVKSCKFRHQFHRIHKLLFHLQ